MRKIAYFFDSCLFLCATTPGLLLSKYGKQQCQDDADEDGGGEGKVEGELLFFNDDITGKFAHPRNLISHQ